jgi:hypothetical protein
MSTSAAATFRFPGLSDESGFGFMMEADLSFAAVEPQMPGSFGATALVQTLYLKEAGDTTLISVNDLHQGQIGDCFLISSMGELALTHSANLTNMIKVNSDGTETVTLYLAANGALPTYGTTSFKAVPVKVSNVFPTYAVNNGATQDVVGNQKEVWAQVVEKAIATLEGGYGGIAYGGNPMIAMEMLTGKSASYYPPASVTASMLTANVAAGDLIVFDTANSNALGYNLVGNHAYMFEKLTTVNGQAMVQLGNPWGCAQPALIPVSQLSKSFVEIDVGRV